MNKQSLGKDAVKLTVTKIITTLVTMVTSMLLSRFRSLEEYGTYSQIMMVITLAISIFTLGLPNSINYFIAQTDDREKRRRFLSNYYTLNTAICIVMGVLLFLATPLMEMYFKNTYIRAFAYVLLIYPWTKVVSSSIENLLVVYQKTHWLIAFTISHNLTTLFLVLLAIWFQWQFTFYMLLFVISEGLFALMIYAIAFRVAGRLKVQLDWSLIRIVLAFSIPLGLSSIMGTLQIETDKLLIGYFFTTEELAIYTNASKELPLSFLATSLTAVLLPKLASEMKKGNSEQSLHLWGRATIISYIVICFFAFGVFTYAPEVVSLLYSEKYLPGVPVFRIYSLLLLLRCTYFGMILNARGKTKFIFYSSVISLVLNALLNFIFYWLFGFIGPAIATICANCCTALFQLMATSKELHVPFSHVFPWKPLAAITVINAVFALLFFFLKRWLPLQLYIGEILESIVLGCIWGILYGILMAHYVRKIYRTLK